jgi:hypothetical protein
MLLYPLIGECHSSEKNEYIKSKIIDFEKRISQARCLCEVEKRMKAHFSCNSIYFERVSKEVASTVGRRSRNSFLISCPAETGRSDTDVSFNACLTLFLTLRRYY